MAGSLQVLGTCGSGDAGQTVRIPMHQVTPRGPIVENELLSFYPTAVAINVD